jgi:D-alanyl-D-alanine carboxypeptidase
MLTNMKDRRVKRIVDFVDCWLGWRAEQRLMPGFAVSIYCNGHIVLSRGWGYADLATKEKLTAQHIWPVASQSKMFTATAVMQLVKQGLISLDGHLVTYLPWVAQHPDHRIRHITIKQLLWHGAGLIRDGGRADYWNLTEPFPDKERLRQLVLESSLALESAVKVKYSCVGYALLGQIIQEVTQQSYEQYCADKIVKPLETQSMSPAWHESIAPRLTTGYLRPIKGERLAVPRYIPTGAFGPSTGWYATTDDMCRFAAAHCAGDSRLLSDVDKTVLHRTDRNHWLLPEHRGSDYALGFYHITAGGRRLVGHSGSFIGHRSATFFDPAADLVVSVAANAKDAPVFDIINGLFEVIEFFQKQPAPPPKHLAQFESTILAGWDTYHYVPTANGLAVAYLETWRPFLGGERFVHKDGNEFLITGAHDLSSDNEPVFFEMQVGKVSRVRCAGTTYLPPDAFLSETRQAFGIMSDI